MASYLRGKGGWARFAESASSLKCSSFVIKFEREEHRGSRYEDSGWSRRVLGLRSAEVQFEAVWDASTDLLGNDYFALGQIAAEDEQDKGWTLTNLEFYPDEAQAPDLYLSMPEAVLTVATISVDVADRVTLSGTIKSQGYASWGQPVSDSDEDA